MCQVRKYRLCMELIDSWPIHRTHLGPSYFQILVAQAHHSNHGLQDAHTKYSSTATALLTALLAALSLPCLNDQNPRIPATPLPPSRSSASFLSTSALNFLKAASILALLSASLLTVRLAEALPVRRPVSPPRKRPPALKKK